MDFRDVRDIVNCIAQARDLLIVLEDDRYGIYELHALFNDAPTPISSDVGCILGKLSNPFRAMLITQTKLYISKSEADLRAMIINEDT